jgi:LacI family transcriptional regulator
MSLKKLAQELNLSISSVSKALRDSHEISHITKLKVLAKAKELNYQANPFASSLRKQKSKTIAVVIPEIENNFFAHAINGIESIAQEKGYHVLIYLTHEALQKEIAFISHLQSGRVDGILMSLSSHTVDTSHIQALKDKGIPLVFFDRIAENIDAPKITTDDYNSSFKATEHLMANGCKKIAFLSISNHLSITNKRMNGYLDALKKRGIAADNNLLITFNNETENIHDVLRKFLTSNHRPDGIVAAVEKLAIASYQVCAELALKIPQDIKIIGFSNLQTAALLNPSMTTITQPAFEIGREAASILFKLVEKKGFNFILDKTVFKSSLVERDSSQGPKITAPVMVV